MTDAYLDIETTGLSREYSEITVVGIYLVSGKRHKLVQMVGEEISGDKLLQILEGVGTIYTYNGSRFDLPFIHASLNVELIGRCSHHDLMYDCWQCNLRGGFKTVEARLGIPRRLQGITGWDAVRLWRKFQKYGDRGALDLLLEYNKEDVMNLKLLREKLPLP